MSRHDGRETDGAHGDGAWLPGGYAAGRDEDGGRGRHSAGHGSGAHQRPRGSTQTSPDSDSQTGPPWEDAGPPWEEPGWDDTVMPPPGIDPAALAGKHPSDPLPSLPSQPLQEGDWPDTPLAFGYAGHEPGYPGHEPGYPGDEPGYPGDAGHPDGGYPGDAGPEPGYPGDAGHEPGYPSDAGPEPRYPGDAGHGPGYPGAGYPGDAGHEPGYAGYPGHEPGYLGHEPGYPGHEPGYPGDSGHPEGGYAAPGEDAGYGYAEYAGTEYDQGSYPEADYRAGYETGPGLPVAGGDFPANTGGFAGPGYAPPPHGADPFTPDAGRYPGAGDYPAEDDDEYLEYGEHTAGPHDPARDHGYPDRGGWYGNVDEQQGWPGDAEDGFLPGMSTGTEDSVGHPGDSRGPGRGRPPGDTGPGKQGTGKTRPGKAGTGKAGGGKRKSRMRRLAPWLALSVFLALLIGAGGGYLYVYRTYLHPPDFSGPGTSTMVVRIFPGDSASAVGQRLQKAGVIASARAFSNAAKASGQGTALEPGYYRVHRHMNAALAFALLLKPSARVQTKITIPEGQRLSQIIATLGRDTGNLQGYRQAINDVKALDLPSFAHGNPEGYLFPATYNVQPNTPPIKVLQEMVTQFGKEAADIGLPAAAAHAELTQAQVITVASLIQAEGGRTSDYPKIARVIYNRLNTSPQIPLQLDSTVMYALHRYGIIATAQQIKVKSPYNTYRRTGLPPGPIDSPGNAAIKAALHPAHGPWMYFVTVNPKTGLTKFTSSVAQFQKFRAELAANIAKGK
jgi:peptidoglycan lytic transglycosylase G